MGTQDRRFRTVGDIDAAEETRQKIQNAIEKSKNIEERRKHGQYATPLLLATEIASFGLDLLGANEVSFLEPAIGTGAFFSVLIHEAAKHGRQIIEATGIELDPAYADGACSVWHETDIRISNNDFTHATPDKKYNLVLTNPPYVRHHYISQDDKVFLRDLVKAETGIEMSGLSGLYCYFMLLAHKWLAPGAICGWLVPSEFMDVNYGNAVKRYLLDQVHLLKVHRYDPASSKFDDALVSSCVVWFKNEVMHDDYGVEFSYSGTHTNPLQSKMIKKSVLLSERKWTRFPEKCVRNSEQADATIGDYFTIKRGLATGDNDFFILTEEKIREVGLDLTFFKPILPSPRHLKTDFIETENNGTPKMNPKFYLLDCELTEKEIQDKFPALWDYLQGGISATSKKYLCQSRKKWYWQEQRQTTRFLCSYMGRGGAGGSPIRFILNLSDAIVTNSYLMLYPKHNLQQAMLRAPDVAYQVWEELKAIGATEIEDEGRVYGGGLKKIEPKELAKVPCSGLRKLCNS